MVLFQHVCDTNAPSCPTSRQEWPTLTASIWTFRVVYSTHATISMAYLLHCKQTFCSIVLSALGTVVRLYVSTVPSDVCRLTNLMPCFKCAVMGHSKMNNTLHHTKIDSSWENLHNNPARMIHFCAYNIPWSVQLNVFMIYVILS